MRTGILSVSKFVKETTFLIYGRYIKEVPFPSKCYIKGSGLDFGADPI